MSEEQKRTIDDLYEQHFASISQQTKSAGLPNGLSNIPFFKIQEIKGSDGPKFTPEDSLKPTNPKDAVGSDKLPLHLWPESATAYGTIGLLNGMLKYGRANWRQAGIRPSIYVDACKRHLTDWFEGNDYDPEDGVHNLSAALACLAILVDSIETGNTNDDRNFNGNSWRSARSNMEPHVKRLKELHTSRTPKHFTIKDGK